MKGLEFVFLAVGSALGAFLRYKITESPLLFNTLPLNVLIVNVIGAFIHKECLSFYQNNRILMEDIHS